MLEILAEEAEIACIRVNQHCGLDEPEAGALGAAPAGRLGRGGVRSGHGDTAEDGGGRQTARVCVGRRCMGEVPDGGVPMLEILAEEAEIACIRVNQHCGLDEPEAGALGAAPAGRLGRGGVRSGHGDTAEDGGGRQTARVCVGRRCMGEVPDGGVPMLEILAEEAEIACICVNQHCGLDEPEAGALGAAPAGRLGHGGVRSGHGDTAEDGGGRQTARVCVGRRCMGEVPDGG
ncbi:hypothetical protein NDU88_003020 [Pleurodeles waltl]|uniref:Uncharacterized protein n=1 Tax=Pleurodeles waltl TaxID=8319 RepID=A0AAV7WRK9_PLEWA|nr:hypothetical protein NDU88_003020 [Pleurodeles waltl]